jgi:hypothetical protein
MNVWEIAILRSINSLGGAVALSQIYDRLHNYVILTENDLRSTQWG